MNNSKLITRAELPSWFSKFRRTEDGNLSLSTDTYILGIPKVLDYNSVVSGNVGGGADLLYSRQITANLLAPGDWLDLAVSGGIATTKTGVLTITLNGVTLFTITRTAGGSTGLFFVNLRIINRGTPNIIVKGTYYFANFTADVFTGTVAIPSGFSWESNQTLQITGESTVSPADNDIFLRDVQLLVTKNA